MIAGALPIGAYELTLNLLFRSISPAGAPENAGLLIALAYRIIQICIASIGVGYWLTSRSEVSEVMHEAQDAPTEALEAGQQGVTDLPPGAASRALPAAPRPRG